MKIGNAPLIAAAQANVVKTTYAAPSPSDKVGDDDSRRSVAGSVAVRGTASGADSGGQRTAGGSAGGTSPSAANENAAAGGRGANALSASVLESLSHLNSRRSNNSAHLALAAYRNFSQAADDASQPTAHTPDTNISGSGDERSGEPASRPEKEAARQPEPAGRKSYFDRFLTPGPENLGSLLQAEIAIGDPPKSGRF